MSGTWGFGSAAVLMFFECGDAVNKLATCAMFAIFRAGMK